jgi:adenylate cyclase
MVNAETRRLAAIMFTDMVGFSRQMGADKTRMLRLLEVHNQIIQQAVNEHHGTVIKVMGDAFLVDFPSVVHAVQCAQQIQVQLRTHNADKESSEQIHVRIGIHSGDIVQKKGDVFGDGVNIAARLQEFAEPDSICISDMVYRDVVKKLDLGTTISLGRPKLKNITERFPVYALLPESPKGLRQTLRIQHLQLSRQVGTAHRVAAGLVLLAATLIAVWYSARLPLSPRDSALSRGEVTSPLPLPDKPSIVVLPFVNMSGDPGQEYFSDGITEELTASLSRLSSLFVISRNSAFFYKGKAVKMPDLSKELGVKYVLEGSLRKAGDQVRITTQLIDATTDHHLWSERYDRSLKDIFALQDEIVQQIVTTLKLQLPFWERGYQVRRHTDNIEAFDYYLRGVESDLRAEFETKKEANVQARQMFERARELDPTYAEAYAGLGRTYLNEWFFQWNPNRAQTLERALELSQRAITMDDSLSLPHLLLGHVYLWNKQHDQAIAELRQAITVDPNFSDNYLELGIILVFAGQPEQAIESIKKGMRLNPRYSGPYPANLGWAYRIAGRCEEALPPLKEAITLAPNFLPAHTVLAGCYAESDTPRKAGGLMSGVASKAITRVCHYGPSSRASQNVPVPSVSASSCSRMYARTCSSSNPTVDTAYPRAQKCSPVKLRSLPPNWRALAMALFPFKKPITCATACLGGMAIHIWT